jgi:hypothetical protein
MINSSLNDVDKVNYKRSVELSEELFVACIRQYVTKKCSIMYFLHLSFLTTVDTHSYQSLYTLMSVVCHLRGI